MPVCTMIVPEKLVVLLWQVLHAILVGIWLAGLPSALVPLWQVAHAAVMPVWLKLAGSQAVVRWQVSQLMVV